MCPVQCHKDLYSPNPNAPNRWDWQICECQWIQVECVINSNAVNYIECQRFDRPKYY